jgi:ribose 5-phosphate isomerase B
MKIAVASDEKTHLTDFVVAQLQERGHDVLLFGPLADEDLPWTLASAQLGEAVARGDAEQGVLFCYTGTGASMAANKIPGIRAALCGDAETARGAKWWNDANVLVMSLRATSTEVANEMLDAWFEEKVREEDKPFIEQLRQIEAKYAKS